MDRAATTTPDRFRKRGSFEASGCYESPTGKCGKPVSLLLRTARSVFAVDAYDLGSPQPSFAVPTMLGIKTARCHRKKWSAAVKMARCQ